MPIKNGKDVRSVPARVVKQAAEQAPYESDIQQACIRWFKRNYPQLAEEGMLFHIANEGIRLGGMGARTKREGVVKGVADLCLSIPMHGSGALYIEMKLSSLLSASRTEAHGRLTWRSTAVSMSYVSLSMNLPLR